MLESISVFTGTIARGAPLGGSVPGVGFLISDTAPENDFISNGRGFRYS